MTIILNLTQHAATPDQIEAGVVDLSQEERKELSHLLTFNFLPTRQEVKARAKMIAEFGVEKAPDGATAAMIGGAPFLMVDLHHQLVYTKLNPCYAFSKRITVEEPQSDGSVKKSVVFKHEGFVNLD